MPVPLAQEQLDCQSCQNEFSVMANQAGDRTSPAIHCMTGMPHEGSKPGQSSFGPIFGGPSGFGS